MRLTAIGRIHSPFRQVEGMPIQPTGVEGRVEVFPEYAEGLQDLDGFSHVVLVYLFHRSGPARLRVVPFLDTTPRGVFATRAPARPNPIGLSTVELLRLEGPVLHVRGVDVLDGTPLLDIKPWVPAFEPAGPIRIGWLARTAGDAGEARADDRFAPPGGRAPTTGA